ncbi:MAG: hypothetical protein IT425_09300 [Pirellulales bacterium]|nr:hypothetical protein [Pirellulales bacterium]
MSTAIASPPLKRFLWKEYRMLRGLWLAVLVLGLLIDWLLGVLLEPPVDFPTARLWVALAVVTLYAAGAAAVLFSVEHEEQTYDFLRGLPTTWGTLFSGKLLVATMSAVVLAAVLALIGMIPGGFRPPSAINMREAASVLGMAIFEALAWGTLCSLLIKRPLAAALVTLVVGTLAVSWVVSAMSSSAVPLNDPASYAAAIPLRLAIAVTLFALSAIVAKHWLEPKTTATSASTARLPSDLRSVQHCMETMKSRAASTYQSGLAMVVRLLWQSWRESWKFLVIPVVVAAACLAIGLCGGWLFEGVDRSKVLFQFVAFILLCSLLASPALLGALAFSADQRRGSIRFLAEHAATPRIVWFSRHMVWLGTLAIMMTLLVVAAASLITNVLQSNLQDYQRSYDEYELVLYRYNVQILHEAISSGLYVGTTAMTFAWCGALAAYAIGQFCSMLLRSEILSTFASLALGIVLIAWIAVLIAWGLSGWMFLLPLAVAFLWATWLRVPYWIVGRNSWRTWAWPTVVISGTLAMVGIMLPLVRLHQVRSVPNPLLERTGPVTVTPEVTAFSKKYEAEATATVEMYLKAARVLQTGIERNPLDPWNREEFHRSIDESGEPSVENVLGIAEDKIPQDQRAAFQAAKNKFLERWKENHTEALKTATVASERPLCRFNFPTTWPEKDRLNRSTAAEIIPQNGGDYPAIAGLLWELIYAPIEYGGQIDINQLFTALLLNYHMRLEQPTTIALDRLRFERMILAQIANWAGQHDRTNEERRTALEKLQTQIRRQANFANSFFADRNAIRKVVNGDESPWVLAQERNASLAKLAFVANELPWERERALVALDLITAQNQQNALGLINAMCKAMEKGTDRSSYALRQWFRPWDRPEMWLTQQPAAATSYLVSMEYQLRAPVNYLFLEYCHTVTAERATILQIALAMYRADHNEYPPTLESLVPEYLTQLPRDPYSVQNFEYRAGGLERPLAVWGVSSSDMIPPHTPLLWSIGPNEFYMQEYQKLAANDAGDSESADPEDRAMRNRSDRVSDSTYYVFERESSTCLFYPSSHFREFVFTLPK